MLCFLLLERGPRSPSIPRFIHCDAGARSHLHLPLVEAEALRPTRVMSTRTVGGELAGGTNPGNRTELLHTHTELPNANRSLQCEGCSRAGQSDLFRGGSSRSSVRRIHAGTCEQIKEGEDGTLNGRWYLEQGRF